jgi:hypothetical protein
MTGTIMWSLRNALLWHSLSGVLAPIETAKIFVYICTVDLISAALFSFFECCLG